MAEEVEDIVEISGKKKGKSNILMYVGAFFLSLIIVHIGMYFYLKSKYDVKWADEARIQDSLKTAAAETDTTLAAADTSDTTGIEHITIALEEASREVSRAEIGVELDTTGEYVDTSLIIAERARLDSLKAADLKKRVTQLTRILEKMKPDESAKILAKLDDEMVVQVLTRMRDRSAAKVMSQMPVSRAARLSKILTEGVN